MRHDLTTLGLLKNTVKGRRRRQLILHSHQKKRDMYKDMALW
jgi:hypothetical protein